MMNVEKRNGLWDSLKFVLIVLVVYGHLLEQSPSGTINRAIFNFIYIFHMPLFIFISGRFSHVKDRKKYVRGIYKLLETFIFFQIVWSFIDYMSLKDTSIMQFFIVPRWTLWYLLSLVFWRLMVLLLTDDFLMYHKKFIIFSSLIISIIGGFVPVGGGIFFSTNNNISSIFFNRLLFY